MWFKSRKENQINSEQITLLNEFKNLSCMNQEPCPKCHGIGFTDLSGYFDQATICFNKCDLCGGSGSVNNDHEINTEKTKKEIEKVITAMYFDETKTIF